MPLAVARLSDGRLQVWGTDPDDNLLSRWKTTTSPDAPWTAWSAFPTPPGGGVLSIAGGQLEDGRIQLFAQSGDGSRWSCWKQTTNANSAWTEWSKF